MRISVAAIAVFFALTAPAAASQVLEVDKDGRLVPRNLPALPPPAGPELAVPGGEQACPLPAAKPQVSAARGPSVTKAIASARTRRTISSAEATRYRRSYAAARSAVRSQRGRNRREL